MKKNKKGFTLIEVIVSMLILAIASMMGLIGFSNVIQHMSEGASIKNATNQIVMLMDGKEENITDGDIITQDGSTSVQLTLEDGSKVVVEGTMNKGQVMYGEDRMDTVSLFKYSTKIIELTENEKRAIKFIQQLNGINGTGLNETFVNYIKGLPKDDPYKIVVLNAHDSRYKPCYIDQMHIPNCNNYQGPPYFGSSNDIFRKVLYDGLFKSAYNEELWSEFRIDKNIDRNDNVIKFSSAQYLKPYYYAPKEGRFLIYANDMDIFKNGDDGGDWNTRLIFNDDDNHWYYRATGNINLAGVVKSPDGTKNWENLKIKFKNGEDGWIRLYESK